MPPLTERMSDEIEILQTFCSYRSKEISFSKQVISLLDGAKVKRPPFQTASFLSISAPVNSMPLVLFRHRHVSSHRRSTSRRQTSP